MKNVSNIPKPLVIHYGSLVSANPKNRTNPSDFLLNAKKTGQFLNNSFITANIFLQEIQLKDVEEQKQFFGTLDKTIDDFPKDFCIHKVLPQLLNAYEFSTAGSSVLSPLFKIGLLLDDESYEKRILPCIIKLFSSNDRSTRIHLLQQMEMFVKHLQPSVVNNQIFPCVSSGFGDTLPAMREQTVKAMLLLAPKLSEKTLDLLLRHFAKLQMDEQPGIRTNTTICLGKVAQYLSEQTRKKVLIPAFIRSLRDPFPPARSAGVMAILATQQYHDIREVAGRILPALCPLTTDQEKMVRDNVFKAIKLFLSKLEDFSSNPKSPLNDKEAAEKEASGQNGSTWTGWAVSSLTSRFYKEQQAGEKQSEVTPNATQQKGAENTAKQNDNHKNNPKKPVDLKTNSNKSSQPVKNDDMNSVRETLMNVRQEMDKYTPKELLDGDKSDSDYGDDDWQGAGGWDDSEMDDGWDDKGGLVDFGVTTEKEITKQGQNKIGTTKSKEDIKSKTSTITASNGWGDGDEWGLDTKSSSADGWDDTTNSSGFGETPIGADGWNDSGWSDTTTGDNIRGVDDSDERKEKKKQELLKKREERKAQREQNNKNKREKTASGGALKLGAVKKK